MMPGSDKIKFIWEVSKTNIETNVTNHTESRNSDKRWYPYFKGGSFRRWYGNKDYIVDYFHDGEMVRAGDRNPSIYFKDNINWSKISSNLFSARKGAEGALYDDAACQCYVYDEKNYNYILALMNSKFAQKILWCKSQTFNYISSEVSKIPMVLSVSHMKSIGQLVQDNISISKQDWDAHETSWDFQENELVRIFKGIRENPFSEASYDKDMSVTLETVVDAYEREWEQKFHQLHKNEEELNRQFIEIYGLQDELTPDVPLEEVTILQQGEKTILNLSPMAGCEVDENTDYGQKLLLEAGKDVSINGIWWNKDNIIQQFISYAIGCCMGRYRLDRPGLHIAHPNPTVEELKPYDVYGSSFTIDDDAIITILPRDCGFPDNMLRRVTNFIELVFGPQTLVANLNFIEATLGKSLEDYLSKDFWKDHVKRYQKRPIYWLFSSKKGAFKAITYMHRMDAFTVSTIRNHYLLPYINTLETRIDALRIRQSELSASERRTLERLIKDLDDCREYDLRLHQVADQQIAFDLDDGVLVNYAKFGDVLSKL